MKLISTIINGEERIRLLDKNGNMIATGFIKSIKMDTGPATENTPLVATMEFILLK